MLVISLILIGIIVVFFAFNIYNNVNRIVAAFMLSIVFMSVVATVYLSKTISYTYFFNIDFKFYLLISKLKIELSTLSRLYNISLCFFMISSVEFYIYMTNHRLLKTLLFLIPILLFLLLNDPAFNRYMEVFTYTQTDVQNILTSLYFQRVKISIVSLLIYAVIPIIWFAVSFVRERIKINRKFNFLLLFCITLTDIYVYLMFFKGRFSPIMVNNIGMARLPVNSTIEHVSILMLFLFSVFIVLIVTLTWYYKPLIYLNSTQKKKIERFSNITDVNASLLLHEMKNKIITMGFQLQIAEKNIKMQNYENSLTNIQKGIDFAESYLNEINEKIKLFNSKIELTKEVNIKQCIHSATANIAIAKNVNVVYDFDEHDSIVFGNKTILIECFKNIIMNSLNSFKKKNNDKNELVITLVQREKYCCISFRDNGSGINKKDIRHIYKLFYSADENAKSTGVGLTFVKKVVIAHNGVVSIKSKYSKYTDVQIILPICRKKGVQKDE